jgi:Bacterial protein of unknown function (DUF899)
MVTLMPSLLRTLLLLASILAIGCASMRKAKTAKAADDKPVLIGMIEMINPEQKEKAATRARDALNAERRKLPMVRIEKDYVFEGPKGKASLLDLFEGRRQLIIYHFMYHADEDRFCDGRSL